ncbi:MAG TPA: T9SS type A sorting domain-containing protein, partial [Cytophagales bacterium]
GANETAQLVLSNGRGGTLMGETLHLHPGDNRVSVPLGGLPAGLYLLRVQQGTRHVVQKVVIR